MILSLFFCCLLMLKRSLTFQIYCLANVNFHPSYNFLFLFYVAETFLLHILCKLLFVFIILYATFIVGVFFGVPC